MSKPKKILILFVNMLYISAFTFGGGFVIASLIKKRFVDKYHWIEENEMLDYIAIAQSCPGAIAVNAAIFTGYNAAGAAGMTAAVLGTVIPPVVILCVISSLYSAFASNMYVALVLKGMQAGVAAVIFDVVFNLAKNVIKGHSLPCIAVMAAAFIAVVFFKVNVMIIIGAAFAFGVAAAIIERKRAVDKS